MGVLTSSNSGVQALGSWAKDLGLRTAMCRSVFVRRPGVVVKPSNAVLQEPTRIATYRKPRMLETHAAKLLLLTFVFRVLLLLFSMGGGGERNASQHPFVAFAYVMKSLPPTLSC